MGPSQILAARLALPATLENSRERIEASATHAHQVDIEDRIWQSVINAGVGNFPNLAARHAHLALQGKSLRKIKAVARNVQQGNTEEITALVVSFARWVSLRQKVAHCALFAELDPSRPKIKALVSRVP